MKLFLHPNALSDERRQAAKRCAALLATRFACMAAPEHAAWLLDGRGAAGTPDDCDAIVAFGGDGTVLRAAGIALRTGKPLLGVNTGRLGYLCALTEGELADFDAAALARLRRQPRTLLEFDWEGQIRRALNEVILAKGDFGTTLDVRADLREKGRTLARWQGDGLLVCTPTGSSAYNRSAGGPLLTPDCGCFALTPICPVDPGCGAVVYPDGETLVLTATARSPQQEALVYADGIRVGRLTGELTVRRSAQALILLEKQ